VAVLGRALHLRPWHLAVAATVGFEALLVASPLGTVQLAVLDDSLLAAAGGIAAIATWRRSRHEVGRDRRGWLLLSLGCVSFGLGQAGFAAIAGNGSPTASPGGTWADPLLALAVPLAAAGLISLAGASLTSRLVTTLDACTVSLSVLFLSWAAFLGPIYHGTTSRSAEVTTLFYVGGSLAITAVVLVLAARWRGDAITLALIGVAFAWLSVTNAAYGVASTRNTYRTGNTLIDVGWFAPFLLIALAGQRGSPVREDSTERRTLLTLFVPYLAILLVAGTTAVFVVRHESFDLFLQLCGVTVVVLVLVRQVLTLSEVHALTLGLEQRVEDRTTELARSESRLRALLRNSSDVIAVLAEDGTFTYASPATHQVLGFEGAEIVGRSVLELVHPSDRMAASHVLAQVTNRVMPVATLSARLAHKTGLWRAVEATVSPRRDELESGGLVLNIRDVSDRAALEHEMRYQASYDVLTALANRRLFHERVRHALDRAARTGASLCVLFVDLDHFKRVNDTAGHAVGDEVLVGVADRLRECLRPQDTAARLGGDEFAVLLEDTSAALGATVAERIVAALSPPLHMSDRVLTVSASVGVAACVAGASNSDSLLRDADVAMYEAKAGGRSRFAVFHPDMHVRLIEQMELETGLRRAIENEQLRLEYQPLVDLASGEITGVEALLRWAGEHDNDVPPTLFIPLAEERGLIHQLDQWALHEACRQVRSWQERFPQHATLRANVNVSALELREPQLVSRVAAVLEESGLAPQHLMLEITETAVLPEPTMAIDLLGRIRDLGVGVSLDDFGTGNSTLSTLRKFPLDELKIDQSFVAGIDAGAGGRQLLGAVIAMAQALDLRTVAEAVETPNQLAWLRRLHCGTGQGHLFAPALSVLEMERVFTLGLAAVMSRPVVDVRTEAEARQLGGAASR
jgi:diguanylate cyclase (GGDEF)-like protein/PAS domain S-box-containing protein